MLYNAHSYFKYTIHVVIVLLITQLLSPLKLQIVFAIIKILNICHFNSPIMMLSNMLLFNINQGGFHYHHHEWSQWSFQIHIICNVKYYLMCSSSQVRQLTTNLLLCFLTIVLLLYRVQSQPFFNVTLIFVLSDYQPHLQGAMQMVSSPGMQVSTYVYINVCLHDVCYSTMNFTVSHVSIKQQEIIAEVVQNSTQYLCYNKKELTQQEPTMLLNLCEQFSFYLTNLVVFFKQYRTQYNDQIKIEHSHPEPFTLQMRKLSDKNMKRFNEY